MNDWIERQEQAIRPDTDPEALLETIEGWQERAQEVADKSGTEEAIEKCPPSDEEARAIYQLFSVHAETIFHVCKTVLEKTPEVEALELEDVLQEAYPLFQRVLIRYERERGDLQLYLANALKAYVKRWVGGMQHETAEEEATVEDRSKVAPGFDIPRLYNELREEDRLPRKAEELYDKLHPKRQ